MKFVLVVSALFACAFVFSASAADTIPREYQVRNYLHVPGDRSKNAYDGIIREIRRSKAGAIVTLSWYQLGSESEFDEKFTLPFVEAIKTKRMTLRGNIGSSKKKLPPRRIIKAFRDNAHDDGHLKGIKFYGDRDPGPNDSYFNHQKLIAISPDKVIVSSLNFTERDWGKFGTVMVLTSKTLHDRVVADVAAQRANYDNESIPKKRNQLLIGKPLVARQADTIPIKYEHSPIEGRDPVSDLLANVLEGLGTPRDSRKGKLVIVVPRITSEAISHRLITLAARPDLDLLIVSRYLYDREWNVYPLLRMKLTPSQKGYEKCGGPSIHAKYAAYSGSWGASGRAMDVILHGTANFTKTAWTKQQESTLQIIGAGAMTEQLMDFALQVKN